MLGNMSVQMIAHYRVVRRLGAGGMGEVLLAEDTRLERLVAIKLMSAELAKDLNQRKRFHTEAKAASGLGHPNIGVIYEVGETDENRPFLAMEFVEGETLDVLIRGRRLAEREIIPIGIQIAQALEAAHARRVVHRDIKPANIMLDRRGQVKVLDFGLAKRYAQDGSSDTQAFSSALTQTGTFIGTPHYMSPEQVLGREVDHRSDIFSLGVVLYEAVAGQRPFLGNTVGETINNVVNQKPAPPGLGRPSTLDNIILKCLEKNPQQRYASAEQLCGDLLRLHSELESGALSASPSSTTELLGEPRTKLWQLAGKSVRPASDGWKLVGLIVLLVAAALGYYLVSNLAVRVMISILEVGLLAFAGWWWLSRPRARPPTTVAALTPAPTSSVREKSLAVLPFANYSAEKDSDYLSDGLTEEITSALSRLPGLKVAARNSAFAFKGRHEDARKIGEMLRVTMLLEGSVRKSGQQIRVTAQLVNVADGYQIWSESFDRDIDDVIAVQDDIARRIGERLRMEIGAETSAASVQRRAVNPEAHVLYLQARHAWNKRTLADIERAVQLFRRAIDLDAAYAEAHAGLASAYVILPSYAYLPVRDYLRLARGAATQALEIDPNLPEAHAVLGDAAAQVRDFETAIRHLRRALELDPNYATGHQWYGTALVELGRMDEALIEFRKAEELDPLSPIIRACIPEWYYLAGRNEEALTESKKALEIFPDFPSLRKYFARVYIRKGMYREALAEVNRVRSSTPGSPARLDLIAFCEARLGNETEARGILAELEDWRKRGYDVDEEIGCTYVGLREYDKAVDAFERLVASASLYEAALRNPLLADEMQDHPRFQELLARVGLKASPDRIRQSPSAVTT